MRKEYCITRICSFLVLLLIGSSLHSQMFRKETALELEFGAGPMVVMADIDNVGKGGDLGVALRYRVQDHLALRAALSGGMFFGNDGGTDNAARGYKYFTYFGEVTGQLEYWFLKEGRGISGQGFRSYKPKVRPYVYAGGGPVVFFPTHYHENADPLDEFDPYTILLTGGAGFTVKLSRNWFWGFQAGARIVPTDYLDGFSPASSASNDMYYSTQLNMIYRF